MKKQLSHLRLISVLIVTCLFFAGFFISCESDKVEEPSVTKSESNLSFENRNLKNANSSFFNIKKGNGHTSPFNIMTTEVSETDLSFILSKLKNGLPFDERIFPQENSQLVILYLKENKLSDVTLDNIEGFSIWTNKSEGRTKHTLYRINEKKKFELDSRYSVDCGTVIKRDINYLAASLLKEEVNWVAYYLSPKNNSRVAKMVELLDFSQVVMDHADFILNADAVMSCATCNGAGLECDVFGSSCANTIPTDCAVENLQTLNKGSRLTNILNTSKIREIRDDILGKSEKGKEYIGHYYKISDVINTFNVMNASNALEHINLAGDLVEVANIIKNGKSNEIVIDEDLKERALEMIKNYRLVSKNGEFQRILNKIENDVNKLSLKRKADVLSITGELN